MTIGILIIVYMYVAVLINSKTFWCLVYYVLTFLSLYNILNTYIRRMVYTAAHLKVG